MVGGPVVVKSGATLNGRGPLGGALTVEFGDTLQPGTNTTNLATLTASDPAALSGTIRILLNRTNWLRNHKGVLHAAVALGRCV